VAQVNNVDNIDILDVRSNLGRRPAYAVVSTYPPTPCGIASFTAALCGGLIAGGADVGVVRLGGTGHSDDVCVRAELSDSAAELTPRALEVVNDVDVAFIQHEYGIYSGRDGDAVITMLEQIDRPTVVVAHTVLRSPTAHQRSVMEDVAELADAVVVMTEAGGLRLCRDFGVDPDKVTVIPHGAAVSSSRRPTHVDGSKQILTWGLLGPGKGIEWAIDSMAMLDDVSPPVRYRVAGDTHPKVLAHEGERYRMMLERRAQTAGVGSRVEFDEGYRGLSALADMIDDSSLVVLPYDSPDQVTSGVLVDAVAAGCPVVATAFPHAVELLASGAGLVVPRQDPSALADAIRRVLTEPGLADSMSAEARRIAPELAWSAVASRYMALSNDLLSRRSPVSA